jgi:hypothetical protein
MCPPIKPLSPAEVKEEIDKLNIRKAPGYDLICGHILKQLPRSAIVLLTVIFNRMLSLSFFQIIWMCGIPHSATIGELLKAVFSLGSDPRL